MQLSLTAPDHQKINDQVEVTWQTLQTISHSIMVHVWISDKCIHFSLMYMTGHIFTVLPIKHLVNQDGGTTTPIKLENYMKPSVSNLRLLFCPCVVQKATAHVDTKTFKNHHQEKKGFWGILVKIPQHQKGYLIYVPSTWKIFSSHDILFDESFYSA